MKALIAALLAATALSLPSARAADDDGAGAELPKRATAASVVRQESLEMPGITACHQCEWRPKPHTKAAPQQCGSGPDGSARQGVFECGFSPDCERVCNFVQCVEP
jgi:hypothetical protein